MHKRLSSFSDTYEILYPLQALLSLTESIKHSIDNVIYFHGGNVDLVPGGCLVPGIFLLLEGGHFVVGLGTLQ